MTTMTQPQKKNQHFVPQFYLRHFANERDVLFAFDKPLGKSFRKSTAEVASSKFFYDIDSSLVLPDSPPQFIENELAKIEGEFSGRLREVLDSVSTGSPLTPDHKEFLSHLVACSSSARKNFVRPTKKG